MRKMAPTVNKAAISLRPRYSFSPKNITPKMMIKGVLDPVIGTTLVAGPNVRAFSRKAYPMRFRLPNAAMCQNLLSASS